MPNRKTKPRPRGRAKTALPPAPRVERDAGLAALPLLMDECLTVEDWRKMLRALAEAACGSEEAPANVRAFQILAHYRFGPPPRPAPETPALPDVQLKLFLPDIDLTAERTENAERRKKEPGE